MDHRLRAALYARCSNAEQAQKDLSVPAQLSALRRYASDHNIEVVAEFQDAGETGTNTDRPEFQRLLSLARAKEKTFDLVLVWKFNRAFRNVEDAALHEAALEKKGVRLVSITEPTSDDAAGKFQRHMLHAVNEFFSASLSADIRRGLREAASQGHWCRPVPTGYRVLKVEVNGKLRNRLELDAKWAPIIREIFDLALSGRGSKNIARDLNERGIRTSTGGLWSNSAVLAILNREVYTGTLVFGKTRKQKGKQLKPDAEPVRIFDNHPAIISQEEFARVRELVTSRRQHNIHPRQAGSQYMLSGVLKCGKCGGQMIGKSISNKRYLRYVCSVRERAGIGGCSTDSLDKIQLEDAVLDRIAEFILSPDNIAELVRLSNESLVDDDTAALAASVESALKAERKKFERYLDAIGEDDAVDLPELKARLKESKKRCQELEANMYGLVGQAADRPEPIAEADAIRYAESLRHVIYLAEPDQRKSLLRGFIKSITVNLPTVTIEYNLPLSNQPNQTSPIDMTHITSATTDGSTVANKYVGGVTDRITDTLLVT